MILMPVGSAQKIASYKTVFHSASDLPLGEKIYIGEMDRLENTGQCSTRFQFGDKGNVVTIVVLLSVDGCFLVFIRLFVVRIEK